MQMHAFPICLDSQLPHPRTHARSLPWLLYLQAAASASASSTKPMIHPPSSFSLTPRTIYSGSLATIKTTPSWSLSSFQPFHANSSNIDSTALFGCDNVHDASDDVDADDGENENSDLSGDMELPSVYRGSDDGIELEIEKIGKNSRRIRSRIAIEASLHTVWNILTDYERLPDFIPGLAVSQLLERRGNFARLFQIGQQKLAFGLNFNAKGVVDCHEKDLESLPFGQRRDIEFKMIEGDFQLFEGKWSIEQYNIEICEDGDSLEGQEFHTTLSYVVDVEPKLWLPVRLVEGRLCREIKMNLSCIRVEAQKANHDISDY